MKTKFSMGHKKARDASHSRKAMIRDRIDETLQENGLVEQPAAHFKLRGTTRASIQVGFAQMVGGIGSTALRTNLYLHRRHPPGHANLEASRTN